MPMDISLLGEKKYTEAIDVLKLNTVKHPENPNTWDSLGEAYALSGDKRMHNEF